MDRVSVVTLDENKGTFEHTILDIPVVSLVLLHLMNRCSVVNAEYGIFLNGVKIYDSRDREIEEP